MPEENNFTHLLRKRDAGARASRLRFAAIAALFSLIGLGAASYSLFSILSTAEIRASTSDINRNTIDGINVSIKQLHSDIEVLRTNIAAQQQPPPEAVLASQQAILTTTVQSFDKRLRAIESAIIENPEKAIALPLLRKDINDISRRSDELRTIGKAEIDRLYAQQTWMLGGIGTILFTIAGGSITIILKSLPKSKETDEI